MSKRIVETAILACEDKTSLVYAQLLNISGSRFYDTNRLAECREVWENVLKVRLEHYAHNDPSSKLSEYLINVDF